MNRNLVEIALQELGPEDRALLELSVVRGVSDEDIAELLGVDIARVLIKREEALGRVSALIGEDPEDVLRTMRGLPTARWRDDQEPRAVVRIPPEPEPEPEPVSPPPPDEPDDQGRFTLALLGGLAVTLVVVVVLALIGDDDDQAPTPSEGAAAGNGALETVGSSGARGSARIQGSRLNLQVRGLPPGGYVVWLYNSVTDARPVAGRRRGSFTVDATLPGDFRRYRYLDVSREPADGNRNHSGQSVLRVRVAGAAGR